MLKSQFMKVRTEMNSTSSQDEFAKWAKLRRQHDKLFEQLEKMSTWFPSHFGLFTRGANKARRLTSYKQNPPPRQRKARSTARYRRSDGWARPAYACSSNTGT